MTMRPLPASIAMFLLATLACTAAPCIASPPRDPLADAVARFAAFSIGGDVNVAKIAVTLGGTRWYYDTRGERVFRAEPVDAPAGGACEGWATARVTALDRWGADRYGAIKVVMQRHHDLWIGRMLGYGFSDPSLRRLGIDARTLTDLHARGL